MYYDDNGNLKEGKILIKDNIAGFEERKISFLTENGKQVLLNRTKAYTNNKKRFNYESLFYPKLAN